jgi:3-methyl-2-oxobutanoate hydroxymethyltransferase
VLECVPAQVAELVTRELPIPTIGIGAGPACDGQVLVFHDLLGLYEGFKPRFVKRYAEVGALIRQALGEFAREVRAGEFPGAEHSFEMDPGEYARLVSDLEKS